MLHFYNIELPLPCPNSAPYLGNNGQPHSRKHHRHPRRGSCTSSIYPSNPCTDDAIGVLVHPGRQFFAFKNLRRLISQLLPQIIINYRRHNTDGLQGSMMLLWATAGVPLGVYNIVENFNVALRIQPQILTTLSLITWAQCLYYGRVRPTHAVCGICLHGINSEIEIPRDKMHRPRRPSPPILRRPRNGAGLCPESRQIARPELASDPNGRAERMSARRGRAAALLGHLRPSNRARHQFLLRRHRCGGGLVLACICLCVIHPVQASHSFTSVH
jgi:PQ loop repeat